MSAVLEKHILFVQVMVATSDAALTLDNVYNAGMPGVLGWTPPAPAPLMVSVGSGRRCGAWIGYSHDIYIFTCI